MKTGSDWYKREPLAYLGGVQGMTKEEHAVYGVVVELLYVHGGSINNDPKWISGWISNMGSATVRKTLESLCLKKKLQIENDQITQKRAKKQAKTKEELKEKAKENGEKGGKKSAEIRSANKENNDLGEAVGSTETQPDKIREDKSIGGGGGSAGARDPDPPPEIKIETEREMVLHAMGLDPISGMAGPNGKMLGGMADMMAARAWKTDLGLTLDEILGVIRETISGKPDGPPESFAYFNKPMARFAGLKDQPKLTPIEGGRNGPDRGSQEASTTGRGASRAHQSLIAGFARSVSNITSGED